MQKYFFESLYKIFLILKLAPIVAQKSLWKGKTKFNIPSSKHFPCPLKQACPAREHLS